MAVNFASVAVRLALVLALVGLWLFSYPERSYACSCVDPGSPSEALERSGAVFVGRVVSLDRSHVKLWSADPIIVEFDVETVWKGPAYRTIFLTTAVSEGSCGYTFDEGFEYLVYSWNGSEVNWCSRTRPLSQAAYDLAELGPGQAPPEGTTGPTPAVTERPPPPTPVIPEQPAGGGCGPSPHADGLQVVGLMAGVAWLGLRKRRSR